MTTVGIDRIGFYTPNKYLDLRDLAKARKVAPNKYLVGIGQDRMSLADCSQDIVSMAINATQDYLAQIDKKRIGLLILATETSIDQSKAASLFVKAALQLPDQLRTFEVKEACFGLTAALQIAHDYVRLHPSQTAIVIGSDIARYGLKTPSEVTQGAGSISLLISAQPHLLKLADITADYSASISDFWRPNDSKTARVQGKYSTQAYLDFFSQTFSAYQEKTGYSISDFTAICYHLPFTKMGVKASQLACQNATPEVTQRLQANLNISSRYCRAVGNIYTGSLWLSLLSLLEQGSLKSHARIGLFSYGSGAMAEFLSVETMPNYHQYLFQSKHMKMLEQRQSLSISEYEILFEKTLEPLPNTIHFASDEKPLRWYFAGQKEEQRQYVFKPF